MLECGARIPTWVGKVLARHELVGITDTLPSFSASWEMWAAEVAESHTPYPVLLPPDLLSCGSLVGRAHSRSSRRSDAPCPCALDTASSQARLCLRQKSC